MPRANDKCVGTTLPAFISEWGVPENLTMDGAKVHVGKNANFQKTIWKNEINFHISHPRRPDENPAEGGIREIKRLFYRIETKRNVPGRLWDFLLDYVIEIQRIIVNGSRYAKDRTPIEIITGITPDISEYMDFQFYEWVRFRENAGLGQPTLGRWLGVSHRRGNRMTYWILPKSGIPISCDSVQRCTTDELRTEEMIQNCREFTMQVNR